VQPPKFRGCVFGEKGMAKEDVIEVEGVVK
jgi:hypothetical protein